MGSVQPSSYQCTLPPSHPAAYPISSALAFHGFHVPETPQRNPSLSQQAAGQKRDGVVFLHIDRIPGEDLDSRGRGNRAAQRLSLGTRSPLCFSLLLALAMDLQGPDIVSSPFQSSHSSMGVSVCKALGGSCFICPHSVKTG